MKLVQPLFHLGWLEERSCRKNLHIEKQNLELVTKTANLIETRTYYKRKTYEKCSTTLYLNFIEENKEENW